MGLIDFILNLAGLLLWLNWRAAKADPLGKPKPATLIGTLRRADPTGTGRWQLPTILGGLLLLRALFYWQIGSAANWSGKLDLGVTAVFFHSNSFRQMLLFSVFSFARIFGIFYLCLLLLSMLRGPMPTHQLVRIQLGQIDGWSRWAKCLLPLVVIALGWGLASWPFAWLHPKPSMPAARRIEEAVVIALNSYLVWKFLIAALLGLHLLNSYIYFGKHPLWNYVDSTAQTILRPLRAILLALWRILAHLLPRTSALRSGTLSLSPSVRSVLAVLLIVVGIVLTFLLASLAGYVLTNLYRRLSL